MPLFLKRYTQFLSKREVHFQQKGSFWAPHPHPGIPLAGWAVDRSHQPCLEMLVDWRGEESH